MAQQAKQVLQACERTPKDEVELNYDSRNPFVVCSSTFMPIYRGTKAGTAPQPSHSTCTNSSASAT